MFYSDKAIANSENDLLNRKGFAKLLAHTLMDLSSRDTFTVGLFGKWGSGKTSIVNMAVSEIERCQKNKDVSEQLIIVRFEPWNFSDTNQLLTQFFVRLSNEFQKKGDRNLTKIGKALEQYSDAFSLLELIPGVGSTIATVSKWSLLNLGKKMQKALMMQEQAGASYELLEDIRTRIPEMNAERAKILVSALTKVTCRFNKSVKKSWFSMSTGAYAEHMLLDIIERIPDTERLNFFSELLSRSDMNMLHPIASAINMLELGYGRLGANGKERNYNKVIRLDELEDLEKLFCQRTKEILKSNNLFDFTEWRMVYHLLESFDPQYVEEYLKIALHDDLNVLKFFVRFVSAWTGTTIEYEVQNDYTNYLTLIDVCYNKCYCLYMVGKVTEAQEILYSICDQFKLRENYKKDYIRIISLLASICDSTNDSATQRQFYLESLTYYRENHCEAKYYELLKMASMVFDETIALEMEAEAVRFFRSNQSVRNLAETLHNLATTELYLEKTEEITLHINECISLFDTFGSKAVHYPLNTKGIIQMVIDRNYNEAIFTFSSALSSSTETYSEIAIRTNLIQCLIQLKRYDEARQQILLVDGLIATEPHGIVPV